MAGDAQAFAKADGMGQLLPGQGGLNMDMLRGAAGADLAAKQFEAQFAQQGPMGMGHMPMPQMPMQHQQLHPSMHADAMMQEFQAMNMHSQQQARMQQAEFEAMYAQGGQMQNMGAQWAKEAMAMGGPQAMAQSAWATEFEQSRAMGAPGMGRYDQMMGMGMGMGNMGNMGNMGMMGGMGGMGMGNMGMMGGMGNMNIPMFQPPMQQMQQAPMMMQEEAKEAAPVSANPLEQAKTTEPMNMGGMGLGMDAATIETLLNSDNDKWRNSKFLKFINKVSKGEIDFRDNQAIEKTPQQIMTDRNAEAVGDEWAAEFDTANQEGIGTAEGVWDGFGDMGDMGDASSWADKFQQMAMMPQRDPEYVYSENNKFLDAEDPYQLGLKLYKEGKLKEAINCFEVATQKDPENAEAWRYLGSACAENENEKGAIAALLRSISIDPYNLPALMMLGVSYTNDLEETRALTYLKTWMLNNPEYQGSPEIEAAAKSIEEYEQFYGGGGHGLDGSLHNQVIKMFQLATNINKEDADLFTVLGVLHHISSDFDQAIEAFRSAVRIRPSDPALWNKLGATQANSMKSSDAVHAYKRALELRPSYVRALANLAISFANQGLHEDAARTYLATLKQNPNADHVWSYLRISLSNLDRKDLVQLTEKKDVEAFRSHFQF